jgi:acyl dehydratase
MMAYYEDVVIGDERLVGSHEFTRESIIAFAQVYDPQRFHIDEAAAKHSIFGGLCASGWHVAAASMRALVDYRAAAFAEIAASGETVPPLGVSPGITNLRWPNPTRPGDVVAFHARVLDKRETRRPDWGIVGFQIRGVNQHGKEAITYENRPFVARRAPSA